MEEETIKESEKFDLNKRKAIELQEENNYLKTKIAFSLGALEGINYLLKNEDPVEINKNLTHLRSTVNRVLDDLRKDF